MIQLINLQREMHSHDFSSSTPQLTPVENLIAAIVKTNNVSVDVMRVLLDSQFKEYERTHIREQVSKGIDWAIKNTELNSEVSGDGCDYDPYVSLDIDKIQSDKQTYLNQNHPL